MRGRNRWIGIVVAGAAVFTGACGGSGGSGSTVPPGAVSGTWTGIATFIQNCSDPGCQWNGNVKEPAITLEITQTGGAVAGTLTLNVPGRRVVLLRPNAVCDALDSTGQIRSGSFDGTRLTFTDADNNDWSLQLVNGRLEGSVSSEAPFCSGLVSTNVSLSRN